MGYWDFIQVWAIRVSNTVLRLKVESEIQLLVFGEKAKDDSVDVSTD